MKCIGSVLAFLLVAGSLATQEPEITPNIPVDSATLENWLHSDDPRLLAWAADFTRRNPDQKILAEMPALLEHWSIPLDDRDDGAPSPQIRAGLAVLDTLIQTNVSVPVLSIHAIARAYPAQAAILIGRHTLSQSRSTLEDWARGSTGTSGNLLARVASMMLAKDPKGSRVLWNRDLMSFMGLVASVVAASETQIHVSIESRNLLARGVGTGVCADFFGRKSPPGWPKVYSYSLAENDSRPTAPVVVELDGDRIVSRRRGVDDAWGSCGDDEVEALDPATRHRLIAHWLGVTEKDMAWKPDVGTTIMWAGKTDYERRLGAIIESQREKLGTTVSALRQLGFLTEEEAAAVTPRLSVVVKCDIHPCPLHVP